LIDTVADLPRCGRPREVAIRRRGPGGAARTYGELDERTSRAANGLLGKGLKRGDRLAAWMDDGIAYVELYLAAAKAGLVIVPINARFLGEEAGHILRDSGARALAFSAPQAERVDQLGVDVITLDEPALEGLLDQGDPRPPAPPARDDLYILGYTSGTTGPPKGAMLTHRSVLAIARLNAISYRLPIGSVAALTGSMSFVATVPAHILTHLYVGGRSVIMGRWDVQSLLHTIAAERITFTYLPSPTIPDFTEAARGADLHALRSVLHSASRAEPDKLRALCEVIGDRFVEGWGMTENSGGLMTATRAGDGERTFTTVGRAAVETAIVALGPDGETLEPGQVGELAFRSPALMDGYWSHPSTSTPDRRGGPLQGWFHSGDLGALDEDGFVTIADRRTDLIVSGGMNVYPSEVEDCIAALAGVRECAVVGLPHERWGQTVVAVVVGEVAAEAVVEHCRERLASYKKPTSVVFLDALPRTTSGKVRRGAVRDLVKQTAVW
jgi:acyl-CoA synthetase (AMP-forming)/AMP-acid ligase II